MRRRRFSSTEISFFVLLLAAAVLGVTVRFAGDPHFWAPVMKSVAGLVVVSLVLNVLRVARAALASEE